VVDVRGLSQPAGIRGDGTVTAPTTQLEVDRLLPWLPAFGAAVIFVVILWLILSMLGVVPAMRGGELRVR
jgi:hypothetical protein